ncbi:hypothetical protein [Angustibacter sp. Root456]|jgi:hypothetical protein|uniref:hypothetical protein n=1 Tax=Angustibacter sp. Root456 TaxID=1736539 RepID=UPI0006FA2CF7|nr:hypothetical protein [Angustibacter sp. Root456]KQX65736.1 hypothetical protein ASD06_08950 [Angustibacter sp. Root456]
MQDSHDTVDQPDDVTNGTTSTTDAEAAEQTKELLEEHVPLSLIMDLTAPDGPHSKEILDAEGAPEQAWWEQP